MKSWMFPNWKRSHSFFPCLQTHTGTRTKIQTHTFSLNEVKTVAWGRKVTHTNPCWVGVTLLCAEAWFDWQATPCKREGRWFAWARNSPSHLRAWLLAWVINWVIRDLRCLQKSMHLLSALHQNRRFPGSCYNMEAQDLFYFIYS